MSGDQEQIAERPAKKIFFMSMTQKLIDIKPLFQ